MPAKVPFPVMQQPLYERWSSIWRRCYSPKAKDYPRYGGRGITVCKRWHDFWNFQADLLPTYAPGLTLERINNKGNYTAKNCRWATPKEQAWNRRDNVIVDSPWGRINLADAAERSGINYYTLWSRLEAGRPLFGPLLTGGPGREPEILVDTPWGRLSLRDAAAKSGVPRPTLYWRWQRGRALF